MGLPFLFRMRETPCQVVLEDCIPPTAWKNLNGHRVGLQTCSRNAASEAWNRIHRTFSENRFGVR